MPKKGKKTKKGKRPAKRLSIKKEKVKTGHPKVIIRDREIIREIKREVKRVVPSEKSEPA
jgi:hypothetical protein